MAWLESDFKMELKNTLKYHLGSKGPEKYHMVRKIRDRNTYVTSTPAGRGYPSTLPLRTLHYASKFHDMRHVTYVYRWCPSSCAGCL